MPAARVTGDGRGGLALASLLLIYLTLAIAYQRAVPLFEAPDEPSHIHYVAFLSREGRPPSMLGRPDVPGEGMQPALYYAALAPLFAAISGYDPGLLPALDQVNRWAYGLDDLSNAPSDARIRMNGTTQGTGRIFSVDPGLDYLRALRWGSLAFGVLAVLCTFVAAHRVSGTTAFAVLCTALFALSPQFLFVSGYVNNDVACAALGAAAFLLFAVAAERERVTRGSYLAAAVLLALGLATKHSALPALVVCFAALFALDRRPLRTRLEDAGLAGVLALVLALPSLWMNQQRFGGPLGVSAVIASADSLEGHEKYGGLTGYFRDVYVYTVFRSYWATFGWLHVIAPDWAYLALFALCWSGVLGLLLGWRAERRARVEASPPDMFAHQELRRSRVLRRYLLATALATLTAHLWINLQVIAVQGRHLFGAAPQIAALLTLGIASLAGGRAFAVGRWSAGAITAGMAALALYCLTRLLLPVYA